jgi:hypothetical protein
MRIIRRKEEEKSGGNVCKTAVLGYSKNDPGKRQNFHPWMPRRKELLDNEMRPSNNKEI